MAAANVDPNTMTNNWSAGLGNLTNQQKLVNKYVNSPNAFNADPQGAQTAWQNGINRAQQANKYATGMAKANVQQAKANMQKFGGQNWSNAGQSKQYKYAAVAPALAGAINAVQTSISTMPKGKGQNNIARMVAWAQQMGAYYGKIKA